MPFRPRRPFPGFVLAVLLCSGVSAQQDAVRPALELPLSFEANLGQHDPGVAFVARRSGLTAAVLDDGLALPVPAADGEPARVVRLSFEGAQPVRPQALDAPSGVLHAVRGADPALWRTVPLHRRLVWRGLAPGLDVELHEREGRLSYDLCLQPGVPAASVVVRCEGADALQLDAQGRLHARVGGASLVQLIPATWELLPDGARRPLPARFVVLDDQRFGFVVEGRDPERALVIDPGLSWATYLGGVLPDAIFAAVRAADDTLVVAGQTLSPDFAALLGGTLVGCTDAFVARIDADAGALVWATLLGGHDGNCPSFVGEVANALALAPDGGLVVGGYTSSNGFPTTPGAFARQSAGGVEAFVARLSAGGALLWSSYLGGSKEDRATGVAIGGDGVFVTGRTFSNAGAGLTAFPTTAGAFDTSFNSIFFTNDAFVSKFTLDAGALAWSTFLGGVLRDEASAIVVDASGAPTVTGLTGSLDFPSTPGSYDPSYNGPTTNETDVFVTRLAPDGGSLLWSTYLGGPVMSEGRALALGADGSLTVAGIVKGADFPVTAGAAQAVYGGGASDGFVARLSGDGASLLWSSFAGGSEADELNAVRVDAFGLSTVAGATSSGDVPVTFGAHAASNAGGRDVLLQRLSADGSKRVASTYYGGTGDEGALALALDAHGAAFVAGGTGSIDLPLAGAALDATAGGAGDAFAARLPLPPWADLGFAKAGGGGVLPRLVGAGSLEVGSPGSLTLSGARPSAACYLFIGFAAGNAPFKGGTLVPFPAALTLVLFTFPDGTLPLAWPAWPAGIPPGFALVFQCWIADPAAPNGASASNGVSGLQP